MTNRLPSIIFITGPDGVGKTTLADLLASELEERGIVVNRGWARYHNYLSKPLLLLAKCMGLNYREKHGESVVGYHDFHRCSVLAWCFVFLQSVDANIATLTKLVPKVRANEVLICDRGPYDTLFDVMIDTGFHQLGMSFWTKIFTWSLRSRTHVVLAVERDLEAALASPKEELRFDRKLPIKYELYRKYARHFSWARIQNDKALSTGVARILEALQCEERESLVGGNHVS